MMPSGVQTEDSAVQDVREPGDRMPIVSARGGERPANAFISEAGLNVGVVHHIAFLAEIIIVNKIEMTHWVITDEGETTQRQANQSRPCCRR